MKGIIHEEIQRFKNRLLLKEGHTIKIDNNMVVEEWKGIEAIIIKKEKYCITKMIITKGNKFHRKGGKLWRFPYGLVIKWI